jgi:hypothetical protein
MRATAEWDGIVMGLIMVALVIMVIVGVKLLWW